MNGVSIIIPAYNSEKTIAECISAAQNLDWDGEVEVIVVNDGSSDRTADIASTFPGVKVINTPNGGAPRATNIGIQAAHNDIVVSLDSDAILEKHWLQKIIPSFDDPTVGAVAGYALTGNKGVWGKIMGYDVELRLDKIKTYSDHLYTMNTAYRRQDLIKLGMFDEKLCISYDGDISRRLIAAGYRLVLRKDATCRHYWRDDLRGFLRQQYKYAYYRLEQTRKWGKPQDKIVNWWMIIQVPLTLLILVGSTLGTLASPFALLGLVLLPLIHIPEAITLLFMKKDICTLALPLQFTARNIVWAWSTVVWGVRRYIIRLAIRV